MDSPSTQTKQHPTINAHLVAANHVPAVELENIARPKLRRNVQLLFHRHQRITQRHKHRAAICMLAQRRDVHGRGVRQQMHLDSGGVGVPPAKPVVQSGRPLELPRIAQRGSRGKAAIPDTVVRKRKVLGTKRLGERCCNAIIIIRAAQRTERSVAVACLSTLLRCGNKMGMTRCRTTDSESTLRSAEAVSEWPSREAPSQVTQTKRVWSRPCCCSISAAC